MRGETNVVSRIVSRHVGPAGVHLAAHTLPALRGQRRPAFGRA